MPHWEAASERPASILKQQDSQDPVSPSSLLGMTNAVSPRATPKSVSIAPRTELISPLILGKEKNVDDMDLERSPRRSVVKRPVAKRGTSSRFGSISSPFMQPFTPGVDGVAEGDDRDSSRAGYGAPQIHSLLDQVATWIFEERSKQARRNKRGIGDDADEDMMADLDKLESIFKQNLNLEQMMARRPSLRHRGSSKRLSQRKGSSIAASDTEYLSDGGEMMPPSCDVILDNSKTMAYTGGASDESDVSSGDEATMGTANRDQDAWANFKFEIVRLSHTLRLKGWRKVEMEMSGGIHVQRLSGALTNAVYVVSPPDQLPPMEKTLEGGKTEMKQRKPPPKLLLRIYGPQVEHLIDREAELAILRRLSRKRIGPRMLGTFANGRFEEFFNAETLTAKDLRNPDTSVQIAKRMRELHEGIDLLDQERDDGPFVWRNWDKWTSRLEQVVSWLDEQIEKLGPEAKPTGQDSWKRRGYICGVPYKTFRETVEKYRAWLNSEYGGIDKLREHLVFAHNDTQYGNILRLVPTGESPLLAAANSHKRLIVIDFEYSNANMPGLEFANHFTEWCYDYHEKRKPYVCHTGRYPTPEEQDRFLRAYVRHQPHFSTSSSRQGAETPPTAPITPGMPPRPRPKSNISEFMLDARAPHNPQSSMRAYDEEAEKASEDAEVARLQHETRLWRLANTTQWVAWGIVQAKVPGMPDFESAENKAERIQDEAREDLGDDADDLREAATAQSEGAGPDEQDEEFDYLGYAQHRAMFFWGDALQLGLVKPEDLPEELRAKVKTVPY